MKFRSHEHTMGYMDALNDVQRRMVEASNEKDCRTFELTGDDIWEIADKLYKEAKEEWENGRNSERNHKW